MSINWSTAPRDPWFKIGRLEVGSTMFVVLWVIVSWVAWVLTSAMGQDVLGKLAYSPWYLPSGQLWRLVTWPLANGLGLWAVINLFFFYVFGSELEAQIGRQSMAKLLGGIWAALTLANTVVGLGLQSGGVLAGIGMVQFLLFLVWIFENPNRPFFFNIPAWVIGAVLAGLQVLQLVAGQNLYGLVELLLGFALVAILARRLGLLGSYDWIPGRPSRRVKKPKVDRAAAKQQQRKADDAARLDALLDQINEKGMDSLSPAQRRELMKLRNRR